MKSGFHLRGDDFFVDEERHRFYNGKLFSFLAPRYDTATRILSFGQDQHWKRILVEKLPPIATPRCVDLACGTGDLTSALARKFEDGRIIGLDLTSPMIERASCKKRDDNVSFARQDMCAIGLPGATVDLVTASYALRNAPDLNKAINEVVRVLKPGGVLAYLDFCKPVHRLPQILQSTVLKIWGTLLGLLLHGNPESFVSIPKTLRTYPDRRRLVARLEKAGLRHTKGRRFILGTELAIYRKME